MIGAMEDDVLYPEIQVARRIDRIKETIKREIIDFSQYLYESEFYIRMNNKTKEKILELIIKEGIYEME